MPVRIADLFRSCLIRRPEAWESDRPVVALLHSARETFREQPAGAEKLAGTPEAAAWTSVVGAVKH
jgi:hypothetical protein